MNNVISKSKVKKENKNIFILESNGVYKEFLEDGGVKMFERVNEELLVFNQEKESEYGIQKENKTLNIVQFLNRWNNMENNIFEKYFKDIRENFLNSIDSKLQKGRINSYLLNSEDDISINRYSQLEKFYLLGWRFKKDRIIFINDIEKRLPETEIKYIKFLSEIE